GREVPIDKQSKLRSGDEGECPAPLTLVKLRENLTVGLGEMKRGHRGRRSGRKALTIQPGIQSKIVPQRELHAPRVARTEDLAEERAEIGIGTRNTPVGMVEGIEAFRGELDRTSFADKESALKSEVEQIVARTGNGVAAGVAKSEGRGRRKSVGIEEMIRR